MTTVSAGETASTGSPLQRWFASYPGHILATSHVAYMQSEHLTVRRWDVGNWQKVGA